MLLFLRLVTRDPTGRLPEQIEGFKGRLITLEAAAYLDKPSTVIGRPKEIVPAFQRSIDSETSIMRIGTNAVDEEVAG